MVGNAATIRYSPFNRSIEVIRGGLTAGLVILPFCMGTLKSTRMRTRLSLRSRSVIESLFERDMVVVN